METKARFGALATLPRYRPHQNELDGVRMTPKANNLRALATKKMRRIYSPRKDMASKER
jgi:hypothetical protein